MTAKEIMYKYVNMLKYMNKHKETDKGKSKISFNKILIFDKNYTERE